MRTTLLFTGSVPADKSWKGSLPLSSTAQVYDFHGLGLSLDGSPAVLDALSARIGRFPVGGSDVAHIRFSYHSRSQPRAEPPDVRVVYESEMGRALYSEDQDSLFIRSIWSVGADVSPSEGRVTVCVDGAQEDHVWALSHPMFTLPLIELLKRRDRFNVHAAGLAVDGKALLLAGTSGSGKSTLSLALARLGFGFMSDDLVFLAREESHLTACAFPEAFDLTESSLRLFPDLAHLLDTPRQQGWPKHQLPLGGRLAAQVVWSAQPSLLVFPQVHRAKSSLISPLTRSEALLELVPNVLLTETVASQRHLDALGDLVNSCACYRLQTGTDFPELALRLRELLASSP